MVSITAGEHTFAATLVRNSSTEALLDLLRQEPITIDMRDYANMEKVGALGVNLPTNDEPIDARPGDLILYQGNSFVIYYGDNHWSLTRLGRIEDVTGEQLKTALGDGDVSITIALP